MSKAILVVDVPDNLRFKELFVSGEIRYTINSKYKYQYFLKDIFNYPLKPMPKKISPLDVPEKYKDFGNAFSLARGYNACLKEISGEEENENN